MKNDTSDNETPDTDHLQFQQVDGKEKVLPAIKEKDAEAILCLIKPILQAKLMRAKVKQSKQPIDLAISDIGCGEGLMLSKLLELLQANLTDYLNFKITVYGCEPNEELREKFLERFKSKKVHLQNVVHVAVTSDSMEKYQPQQSDVFLLSHSLYFSQSIWNTQRHTINNDKHLLIRFLRQLKENGQFIVVLQSNASSERTGKHGGSIAGHEGFETVMYPITRSFHPEKKIDRNQDRDTYTNAEIFETCLKQYMRRGGNKRKTELSYKSKKSFIFIELGNINFDKFNPENNRYEQEESVQQLLNFYTRGLFPKYNKGQQEELLGFIKNNCITEDGVAIMCHVNKVFVLTEKKFFPQDAQTSDTKPSKRLKINNTSD